jgi:hypothetical protein
MREDALLSAALQAYVRDEPDPPPSLSPGSSSCVRENGRQYAVLSNERVLLAVYVVTATDVIEELDPDQWQCVLPKGWA